MTLDRREVLGTLGAASASTLLWALGCSAPAPIVRRAPQVSGEVRTWLHDAVSRLATLHATVHALAVSRSRTTAARDVLGAGVAHLRSDGVVLSVRSRDGTWHDHVTSELSLDSVDAAARALGAGRRASSIDFGRPPPSPAEPPPLDDRDLVRRVDLLLQGDAALAPRIVYAAAAIDVDDAIVWSVAPGRDLEQRLVRIRHTALRAAGSGRPVVRTADRAWTGWIDDQPLTPAELVAASESALEVITPGGFDDGERPVVLDPSVVAVLVDATVRGLFTSAVTRRPEIAHRLAALAASGAGAVPRSGDGPAGGPRGATGPGDPTGSADDAPTPFASPHISIIDDPTIPGAYGGFAFDDEGEPAAPLTLVDAGRITGRLADRAGSTGPSPGPSTGTGPGAPIAGRGRRPGHLGHLQPSPSHLRLVPGTTDPGQLLGDGFLLEGGVRATLDPSGEHIRIACTRARELKAGNTTGRLYADVELVGSLTDLLSAVDAVATTPTTFAPHTAPWRSISAPALRTRGFVRALRTRA